MNNQEPNSHLNAPPSLADVKDEQQTSSPDQVNKKRYPIFFHTQDDPH